MKRRTKPMGRVDHQRQVVFSRDGLKRGDITGISEIMAGGNGDCSGGDRGSHRLGGHIRCDRVYIDKNGTQIVPDDGGRGREKGEAWQDHLA